MNLAILTVGSLLVVLLVELTTISVSSSYY